MAGTSLVLRPAKPDPSAGRDVLECSATSLPFSVHPRASGDPAKRAASEIKQARSPLARGRTDVKHCARIAVPSCPALCRASTSLGLCTDEDVDGRDKPCAQAGEARP